MTFTTSTAYVTEIHLAGLVVLWDLIEDTRTSSFDISSYRHLSMTTDICYVSRPCLWTMHKFFWSTIPRRGNFFDFPLPFFLRLLTFFELALDMYTTSPLPVLFNLLTHLTYLTSISPRIREIMTMVGGLERLLRILHEFCICPPPPENPAILYSLIPPNSRPPKGPN